MKPKSHLTKSTLVMAIKVQHFGYAAEAEAEKRQGG
jgi:hypothetical protein